jgi:hypothetical protein
MMSAETEENSPSQPDSRFRRSGKATKAPTELSEQKIVFSQQVIIEGGELLSIEDGGNHEWWGAKSGGKSVNSGVR